MSLDIASPNPVVKLSRPELKVVFDSNAIYSGTASDLVRHEVAQLIQESSKHSDLIIRWYLPEVVVHERQYQMQRKGFDLLPSIEKLEKLLGHGLGINVDIIKSRVEEAASKQIKEHGLIVRQLTVAEVDWSGLILDAVYRRPPFEAGEKEKGFRDALIAETFLQVVAESPSTPRVCRVALVTEDKLLAEAAERRTTGRANVRILASLDGLRGLINTLVAEVDEQFVNKIRDRASALFFTKDDKESLYYKDKVSDQIRTKFAPEFERLPAGATQRQDGTWFIGRAEFVTKHGQRITWLTRITIETKAARFEFPAQPMAGVTLGTLLGPLSESSRVWSSITPTITPDLFSTPTPTIRRFPYLGGNVLSAPIPPPELAGATPIERIVATGKSVFEVVWSVSVSMRGQFTKPKIEEIRFVETAWN